MRRLIKSLRTSEYLRYGQWTTDPSQAEHFADAGKAIDACLKYHLTEVELVLQPNPGPEHGCDTHVRLFDYGAAA